VEADGGKTDVHSLSFFGSPEVPEPQICFQGLVGVLLPEFFDS
jgi:hypothetical protein